MEQRKLWDLLEYQRLVSAKVSGEEFELGDKLWNYLNDYAEAFGIPSDKWGLAEWQAMTLHLARVLIKRDQDQIVERTVGGELFSEVKRRNKQDKNRIKNRKDQQDKLAFQGAVKANISIYTTKADAIRDLRIKPQFQDYPDKTLRSWLTSDIWDKPTKRGAPKKVI